MADEHIDPRITLIEKAWATKEARPLLEKSLKIAFPNAEIPGLALREAAEAVEAKAKEHADALDAKLARFEAQREHDRAIADLTRQGYNADDVKAIEDIMTKEGIGLHTNAAIVYDTRRKVAAPRTPAEPRTGGMTPRAYGRGAHAAFFGPSGPEAKDGIMDGDFAHPGEDWAHRVSHAILDDFKNNRAEAEAKWSDPHYWPQIPA